MCPLQLLYDGISTLIRYQEGFMVDPLNKEIIATPYQFWSDEHQQWLVPIDYVLCANFSVQTLSIFPVLQYTFRSNILYMEIAPQLAYGIFMIIIALLGLRSHHRFMKLLKVTKGAASAQQSVIRKLEYFKDMNRCLSAALAIGSTAMILLCVDALTETKWLNSHKFAADFLMTHVNYGLYLVFVLLMLIFYPTKNLASDTATIGKNSSLKSITTTLPQSLAPITTKGIKNYRQQPLDCGVLGQSDDCTSSRTSLPSSYCIDIPEENIHKASSLSRNPRPESLNMNTTYIQMSPPLTTSSTLSPLSPSSTLALSLSPPFSPKSSDSSSQSFASLPTSPPLPPTSYNNINYQLPTPIQPAHYNQSVYTKSPETQVIRPTVAFLNNSSSSGNSTSDHSSNTKQPSSSSVSFDMPSKRSTSGSISSFGIGDIDGYYFDSISSFETDSSLLHHGRGNSVGSVVVVDNSSSKRQSSSISKQTRSNNTSASSKISRPPSTTITPIIEITSTSSDGSDHEKLPSLEAQMSSVAHETQARSYVGSGAGIPKNQQSPSSQQIPQQHRKRSSSSSSSASIAKSAVSRSTSKHAQSSQSSAMNAQEPRKRSSSSASLTKTTALRKASSNNNNNSSAPVLKSALKNSVRRSSGSSNSSTESSSGTTKMASKRASPPSSCYTLNNESTISSRSASIKRASPPPVSSSNSPSIIKSVARFANKKLSTSSSSTSSKTPSSPPVIDTTPTIINSSGPSRTPSRKASPTSPPTRRPPSPPTRLNPPSPPARPSPPPPPPRNPNTRTSSPTSPSSRVNRPPLIKQQAIRPPPPSVPANIAFPDNIEEKYILRGTGPSALTNPPSSKNIDQDQKITSEQLLRQYQNILMGTPGVPSSSASSASGSPRSAEIGLAW
ncbi:3684_t:CDS:2 [Ambispora leptoticha]|uniref:3684_t:CDS:1 n=1 Tax=Ambispora leptoticha TaxID=144679 RepID=A0A9N8YNG8_9GLOM|nr:3684_t:CDS:2 [Ambispora leptoticha]